MATNTGKRVSKHWDFNPNASVEKFNIDELNTSNLVNQMLVITKDDITQSVIMRLFGSFNDGKSLCHHYDTFDVPPKAFKFINDKGKEVSNSNKFTTTFGIWIFNVFFLRDFGYSKLVGGYYNENIDNDHFEYISDKLVYALLENKIDTESYKRWIDAAQFFMPFETILSPNHSEKMLSCTKEINKIKAKLIKENQEALDNGDAAVAEDIEKQLLAFAKEYLKDDPSLDPYLSGAGASLGNNFKNMYIMKGAVRNPDPTAKQEFNIAQSSFMDGISADEYSLLANSLVGGPYSRAKKTELGGYWEKLVEVATSTIKLDPPDSDCGSTHYIEVTLTKKNISMFMYSYMIKSNGELEELTSENMDKYIGKTVKIRSVLFCKSKTGVCNKCAGNFFYRRGEGNMNIGMACSAIPTRLKLRSMRGFHNSTVKLTTIDPMRAFGLK